MRDQRHFHTRAHDPARRRFLKGTSDEDFMQVAIDLAKQDDPLIPFGAVIVDKTKMETVAVGVNETFVNPTDHGEIMAIDELMSAAGPITHIEAGLGKLRHMSLYTTGESCPMCMSAIIWCGFGEMIYGSSIPYIAKHTGFAQINLRATAVAAAAPYDVAVRGGVLESKTNALFDSAL
jgi:tRNA(adenine34) deaminase